MPIYPLPQFEADVKVLLDEEDRKVYEALKAPKTLVVRFGAMKLVGEFPYGGDIKPGCGSKMVVRTFRGTEVGEMLTSTCANSGCSKSVSRKEMLTYIENSGGRDYPFFTDGRVLRVASREDLDKQAALEQSRHELRARVRDLAAHVGMMAKIVDVEPILGGETLTVYYLSEERVELRDLIRESVREFRTHVEVRHVGARDEARITADYEKCGQYCCCKNFLKVLRPISMKSAKVQKATLDPLKISGRCGRLMCCLRYEDETYEDLRKRLPRKKSRVGTPEGDGIVIEGQILTQLVLIELDDLGTDGRPRRVAIPVENLEAPKSATAAPRPVFEPRGSRPERGPARPSAGGPSGGPGAASAGAPPRPSTGSQSGSASGSASGSTSGSPGGAAGAGTSQGGQGGPSGGPRPNDSGQRGPRPAPPRRPEGRGPGGAPGGSGGGPRPGGESGSGPGGGPGSGPSRGGPSRGGPGGPRPETPRNDGPDNAGKSREEEIDDLLEGLDDGLGGPSGPASGGGPGGPGGAGGRRRRRRRGRGGGPGGGPPGGGPGGGGPA